MTVFTKRGKTRTVLLLVLGLPLGLFDWSIFSGFGPHLAELYPRRARGLAGAIGFVALGYALCLIALLFSVRRTAAPGRCRVKTVRERTGA